MQALQEVRAECFPVHLLGAGQRHSRIQPAQHRLALGIHVVVDIDDPAPGRRAFFQQFQPVGNPIPRETGEADLSGLGEGLFRASLQLGKLHNR